jgi:hypothetical protein
MPRRAGRRAPDPRRPHRRARHGYALASGQAARWHSAVSLDSSSEQIRPHDGGPAMPCEPLPRPLGTTALVIGGRAGQPVDGGLRPARRLVARQALEGQRTPRDGVNRSGGSPPADSRPDDCRTDRTVEPAPTRATSDEPSHPGAILTPTRDENPDDHPDDHGRERSGLVQQRARERASLDHSVTASRCDVPGRMTPAFPCLSQPAESLPSWRQNVPAGTRHGRIARLVE